MNVMTLGLKGLKGRRQPLILICIIFYEQILSDTNYKCIFYFIKSLE